MQTREWPWFACPNREKGGKYRQTEDAILYARPVVVYLCSIPWASPSAAPSFSCFAGDAAASDIAGSCLSDTLDDLDVVLTPQGVPIRFPDCIDG